jgi:peptidylprolyl isomerase
VLLLGPALTACGSSSSAADNPSSTSGALDAVSISGDVGKSIKATWHKKIAKPSSTTVKTLVKGKGAKIAAGDTVTTYLWIGDGTTNKVAYSDYENGAPESIPSGQVSGVLDKLFEDASYGSRVAAVTTATELLGSSSGNAQLGIGPDDGLVVVADLVEKAAVAPTPSDAKAHDAPASSLPKVIEKSGKPIGLDWAGIAEPSLKTPIQRLVLRKGTGKTVKGTDTVTVNYLGETYQAKAPFESSFTGKPFTSSLGGLIPGWKTGLTGVEVGSRVLLQIPPAYAYGAQGSGSKIPGNATLWFVIDVVKAK